MDGVQPCPEEGDLSMYDEKLLLHELTSCLTVKNANAPEAYILTSVRDIGCRYCYSIESRGWSLPLVNVRTGKFILLVDNGRYREKPVKLMLRAGYLPIFDSSDVLNGIRFRYPDDVNYFLDVRFPSWVDEKRKFAAMVKKMGDKYRMCSGYMPFLKLPDGRYFAVGVTRHAKREFVYIEKGFQQYYPPLEADIVILPPSLEMTAKLGLPVNPADWLVPDPDSEWIRRPPHKPIDTIPEELRRDYMELVGRINTGLKNPPRRNEAKIMRGLRLAEKRLIELEIQAIRGADEEELSPILSECKELYKS